MKKKLLFGFLLLNSTLFFGQSVSKTIRLLPDTGQTQSYTTTFGEDHDYLINTPSFTNNGNGTITDNVTGLMWQQVDGGEMTFENAITYCNNLTLGGLSGWRLPTPIEAYSILNHQNSNPAINTTFFNLGLIGTKKISNNVYVRVNPNILISGNKSFKFNVKATKDSSQTFSTASTVIQLPIGLKFQSDRYNGFRFNDFMRHYLIVGGKFDFDLASGGPGKISPRGAFTSMSTSIPLLSNLDKVSANFVYFTIHIEN